MTSAPHRGIGFAAGALATLTRLDVWPDGTLDGAANGPSAEPGG